MHVFKVELERSSMFVHSIDWDKEEIVYDIRDRETGELLESRHTSHIEFGGDRIFFDNRHIMNDLVTYILGTLN